MKTDLPGARPVTSATPPTATGADDRSTAFRPVEGGAELQSGEKLLVEAYAAIWVILFVMVLLSWRRQRRLDERMSSLEAAIDKARIASEKEG
jgi:CcmD family protein